MSMEKGISPEGESSQACQRPVRGSSGPAPGVGSWGVVVIRPMRSRASMLRSYRTSADLDRWRDRA